MENISINHLAVLSCAALNLLLGAAWYSPLLFYKIWRDANGFTDEQIASGSRPWHYAIVFVLALIISYNLAAFLGDSNTGPKWGLTAGFLAGFGFSALLAGIIGIFERRSWRYLVINGGFMTVWMSLSGLIIGIWR
jgi:hypothetical protein